MIFATNFKKYVPVLLLVFFISNACGQANDQWVSNFQLAKDNTVIVNNPQDILPLKNLVEQHMASLNFGCNAISVFDSVSNKYTHVVSLNSRNYTSSVHFNSMQMALKNFNTLLVSVESNVVLSKESIQYLYTLQQSKKLIVVIYGNEKNLIAFENFNCPIIYTKNSNTASASFVAQLIFGGEQSNQVLSNNISPKFKKGQGFLTKKTRFAYTVPEQVLMSSSKLDEIEVIVNEAIKAKATPGAVVLVAKDGNIIYEKAFGSPTYKNGRKESVNDIFDLASITKISTTTVAMQLYDAGLLKLDSTLSYYLSETKNTNKETITVRELLLHEAGLIPYIPFFERLKVGDYSRDSSAYFSLKVADDYFLAKDYYEKVMYPEMIKSPLKIRGVYVYSDLSMYFLKEIIERITHETLDNYAKKLIYNSLQMRTTTYLPRQIFDKDQIIPTENDTYFRKSLLWGYVHDQGAAMAGGVSGHAGLFSNANDLAILFQLFLNKGSYGNTQLLNPTTVELFTAKQSDRSRRGLGFDRWDPNPKKEYPSKFASNQTFGHTGYTGTCAWADAKYNLVYIFLSNRVHPQVSNKLTDLAIRTRILEVIYQSIQ